MGFFDLFRNNNISKEIKAYLEKGAVVIDVRTIEEWNAGHVKGSTHIVMHLIPLKIAEIKALEKPIITVCRSGARSGQVARLLSKEGIDALNGGPWQEVAKLTIIRNN